MVDERKPEKGRCACPYCDEEIMKLGLPFCQACGVTISYCPKCRQPVPKESKVCPHCKAEIKG